MYIPIDEAQRLAAVLDRCQQHITEFKENRGSYSPDLRERVRMICSDFVEQGDKIRRATPQTPAAKNIPVLEVVEIPNQGLFEANNVNNVATILANMSTRHLNRASGAFIQPKNRETSSLSSLPTSPSDSDSSDDQTNPSPTKRTKLNGTTTSSTNSEVYVQGQAAPEHKINLVDSRSERRGLRPGICNIVADDVTQAQHKASIPERTTTTNVVSHKSQAVSKASTSSQRKKVVKPPKRNSGRRKLSEEKPHLDASVVEVPTSQTVKLSDAALSAISSASDVSVTEQQWSYHTEHNVLPISIVQWESLGELLDEIQPFLVEHGAIVVQPQWKIEPPSAARQRRVASGQQTLQFSRIHASIEQDPRRKASYLSFSDQSRPKFRAKGSSGKEVHDVKPLTRSIGHPLTKEDFESDIERKFQDALYANDVQQNEKLLDLFGIIPRLRSLPGDELPKHKPIAGVNDIYLYFGQQGSSFCLHIEDEMLYSLNLVHSGVKNWRVFSPKSRSMVERLVRGLPGRTCQCDQAVRYKNLYLPEAMLSAYTSDPDGHDFGGLELKYTDVTQEAGQVIITYPGAYHQGFNATPCVAEAVNYAKDWHPLDYAYPSSACADVHTESRLRVYDSLAKNEINDHESCNMETIKSAQGIIYKNRSRDPAALIYMPQLIRYLLSIGNHNNLDFLYKMVKTDESSHITTLNTNPPTWDVPMQDTYSNAYKWIQAGHMLSEKGELVRRVGMYRFALVFADEKKERDKNRSHTKGVSRPVEILWKEVVVRTVAKFTTGEREQEEVSRFLNSHQFKREARAYEKLVEKFGEPILALVPGKLACEAADIESSLLSWIFAKPDRENMFMELIEIMRPSLRGLCQEGGYLKALWDQAKGQMEKIINTIFDDNHKLINQ